MRLGTNKREYPMKTIIFLILISVGYVVVQTTYIDAVHAVEPNEVLKDPKLETRARKLSLELRCLVCQNQSIDDSNAPLAKDLRLLVRERLKAGDTDTQVMDYIVARYGEFVLLRPRFGMHTLLLWLSPVLFLILGAFLTWKVFRTNKVAEDTVQADLSDEENKRLQKLMQETS